MDINMPVMDGIECLSIIKNNPKTKSIPMVILSSATEKKEIMKKLGAKAFLEKPWDDKILKRQIEQMVDMDFTVDNVIANQTFEPKFASLSRNVI
jgi:CheY-like chemotaxis protein